MFALKPEQEIVWLTQFADYYRVEVSRSWKNQGVLKIFDLQKGDSEIVHWDVEIPEEQTSLGFQIALTIGWMIDASRYLENGVKPKPVHFLF